MLASGSEPADSVHERVRSVYEHMRALELTVMDFMFALFWGEQACCGDEQLRGARTAFTRDPRMRKLLRTLHRPPRTGGVGKQPQGARVAMEDFAFELVTSTFKRELEAYEKTTSLDPETVDLRVLQSITLSDIFTDLKAHATNLYSCMKQLMETYHQRRRNTKKTPDTMAAIVISIMVFSRSQRHGKLQNFLSMFFKAEGLPVRCFDTLNAFGLSMSRSWVDRMVAQLSERSLQDVRDFVLERPVCIPSDNLRMELHVDSQRIDNQSLGVNCTAMSVVALPERFFAVLQDHHSPAVQPRLDSNGNLRIINWADLFNPTDQSKIHAFSSFLVRRVLFDLAALATHSLASDKMLRPPTAIFGLPHGADHRTRAWTLGTVPIDQASYEGNALVLKEILRQLDLDSVEHQKRLAHSDGIPFAGDLLTIQRFRGLKGLRSEDENGFDRLDWLLPIHGWFHNRMNLAYAIFGNHRGNSSGDGFAREINPLNRRGLSASTKHPNLHTLDEFLHHFWSASTLENWMWASGTETVDELVLWSKSVTDPQVFIQMSEHIIRQRQSAAALSLLDDTISLAEQTGLPPAAEPSEGHPAGTSAPRVSTTDRRRELDDQRLRSRILLNRDLLLHQVQRYAIKHGDVGLLDVLATPLAIYFKGGGHGNYGNDLLHYLQWRTNESTAALRDLVRHCWLVNTQGHSDSFLPIDEMQEHFNREQREWHSRAGANFSLAYLKKISPAIPTLAATIKHMAENFDLPYRSHKHSVPNAEKDIRIMAARFHQRRVSEYTPGRQVQDAANRPTDYMADGTQLLQKPATWQKVFDEHVMYEGQRSKTQYFGDADVQQLASYFEQLDLDGTAALNE